MSKCKKTSKANRNDMSSYSIRQLRTGELESLKAIFYIIATTELLEKTKNADETEIIMIIKNETLKISENAINFYLQMLSQGGVIGMLDDKDSMDRFKQMIRNVTMDTYNSLYRDNVESDDDEKDFESSGDPEISYNDVCLKSNKLINV